MTPVSTLGSAETARTLAEAREAGSAWAATPIRARLKILRRFRHGVAEHAEELAETVRRPPAETLSSQIIPLADHVRFLERNAEAALAPRTLGRHGRPLWLRGVEARVDREPLGVVLVLAPSNYPVFIPGTQITQALAAGNAVVLGPASAGQPAALALVRLLVEAGIDSRLVRVLPPGPDAAVAAVQARPDKIVLTGSSRTGRSVLAAAADLLIPCILELSGSDAVFVRPDADLARTARALRFGLTLNDGATCIAPRRVLVDTSCHDVLVERFRVELAETRPIRIDPRVAERLRSLHTHACFHGARHVWPAKLDWNRPVGPIVIAGVASSLPLHEQDVFAPVLSLIPVRNDDDALATAARCPYALGASVFSANLEAATRLARRIDAGVVTINDLVVPTADPRCPFGGRRASGYGVTRGLEGLLELTRLKTTAIRHGNWLPHLDPVHDDDDRLFASMLRALHARKGRLGAIVEVARLGWRRRGRLASRQRLDSSRLP